MAVQSASSCHSSIFARALWYVAPGTCELRPGILPALDEATAQVRTLFSAVSRGTERLVAAGLTDPVHRKHMRAPLQDGEFPFPVKYGYCAVGEVEDGPRDVIGRRVFALAPHQERFVALTEMLAPVPDAVPARRATLAANMETALNAVWDGGAGPGDRIVVVGAGLVGLLVTYICSRLPGAEVTVVDTDPARAAVAEGFGARFLPAAPGPADLDADLVFHTSGSSAGLHTSLACCGDEGRVIEMSWYGDRAVEVALGGGFHHKRLGILSSQVGAVSPARRPRWSRRRRLLKALELLADDRLDMLITEEVAFDDLPAAMPRILGSGAEGIATVVRYG